MRSEPPVIRPHRARRVRRAVSAVAALAATATFVACDQAGDALAPGASARGTAPCGTLVHHRSDPPRYRHVVVIMNENTSPAELTPERAPFLARLRKQCGSEGNMHAATHWSDPNSMRPRAAVRARWAP